MQGKPLILVIEGHARLRSELVRRLKESRPESSVVEAEDGETGVGLHGRRNPDVVVTDVILPKLGGLDVITEIKRVQPHVKVIVFSLHDDSQFRERARAAGVFAYVLKEQPLEDIIGAVNAALD